MNAQSDDLIRKRQQEATLNGSSVGSFADLLLESSPSSWKKDVPVPGKVTVFHAPVSSLVPLSMSLYCSSYRKMLSAVPGNRSHVTKIEKVVAERMRGVDILGGCVEMLRDSADLGVHVWSSQQSGNTHWRESGHVVHHVFSACGHSSVVCVCVCVCVCTSTS